MYQPVGRGWVDGGVTSRLVPSVTWSFIVSGDFVFLPSSVPAACLSALHVVAATVSFSSHRSWIDFPANVFTQILSSMGAHARRRVSRLHSVSVRTRANG